MADTQSTTDELQLLLLFVDGDTRTLSLSNPRSDITTAEITALSNTIKNGNILLGDKYGSDFLRIQTATLRKVTKTELDLS